jgi:DUF4097 and DUF4098 domain-containing protein YvlB
MMKTYLSLSFAAFGLLNIAAAQDKTLNCDDHNNWGGNRASFCEMREQTVAPGGRLSIDGRTNGGISVKGWDRAEVLVRSQVRAQGDTDGDAKNTGAQVIVHATAGSVSADGPTGKSWSVSYEVFVPRQSDLNLTAHNGGIHIEGVRGNIEFTTQNGGVHLAGLAGQVKGKTQNGGVHVELAGNRWDGGGLDVQTQNGGVHINVPASYSAHFETSTINGGLHSDFSELVRDRKQRDVSADIGGGGAPVHVVTTNGGVHIGKVS